MTREQKLVKNCDPASCCILPVIICNQHSMGQTITLPTTTNNNMSSDLTNEEIDDLRASFDMFDKDNSGTIDATELQEVMRRFGQKISRENAMELIRSVDIDQNNEIDFTEFLTLMKSRISRDPKYELKLAFDMIDTDNSGTVSVSELRSLMKKCNQFLTEEELAAIMQECDLDGNGELDFEEFQQLMHF